MLQNPVSKYVDYLYFWTLLCLRRSDSVPFQFFFNCIFPGSREISVRVGRFSPCLSARGCTCFGNSIHNCGSLSSGPAGRPAGLGVGPGWSGTDAHRAIINVNKGKPQKRKGALICSCDTAAPCLCVFKNHMKEGGGLRETMGSGVRGGGGGQTVQVHGPTFPGRDGRVIAEKFRAKCRL